MGRFERNYGGKRVGFKGLAEIVAKCKLACGTVIVGGWNG